MINDKNKAPCRRKLQGAFLYSLNSEKSENSDYSECSDYSDYSDYSENSDKDKNKIRRYLFSALRFSLSSIICHLSFSGFAAHKLYGPLGILRLKTSTLKSFPTTKP